MILQPKSDNLPAMQHDFHSPTKQPPRCENQTPVKSAKQQSVSPIKGNQYQSPQKTPAQIIPQPKVEEKTGSRTDNCNCPEVS